MKKEFKYNKKTIIFTKNTTYNNYKYLKNEQIEIDNEDAKKLINEYKAYEKNSFYFDKNIKIGLLIQFFFSIFIIILLNILLIFGIGILSLFIFLETIYFIVGLISIIVLKKIAYISKSKLLFLNFFVIFSIFNIKRGIIYSEKE